MKKQHSGVMLGNPVKKYKFAEIYEKKKSKKYEVINERI